MTDADGISFYLYNAHGDVVQLVAEDGSTLQQYQYDAFGNLKDADPDDTNPFRYCGEYYDAETGTYYLRARYYNPRTGRFTQMDPIRDGLNWYTYCEGNPVAFIDPLGLALVNIDEYAQAMGATTSIYQKDGKDHISVSYGDIIQRYTYYNSLKIDDSILNTAFSWENSWIPNGQKQAVYTGVHEVAFKSIQTGRYHSSVIIFAAPGSKYYDTEAFKGNLYDGGHVQYATLGAGNEPPKINSLQSNINRKKDIQLDTKVQMISMGVYDEATIAKLFDAENYYRKEYTNVNYDYFPVANKTTGYGKGYNSNSFAAGLLNSVGITPITPSYKVPGFDKPLPAVYFGYEEE